MNLRQIALQIGNLLEPLLQRAELFQGRVELLDGGLQLFRLLRRLRGCGGIDGFGSLDQLLLRDRLRLFSEVAEERAGGHGGGELFQPCRLFALLGCQGGERVVLIELGLLLHIGSGLLFEVTDLAAVLLQLLADRLQHLPPLVARLGDGLEAIRLGVVANGDRAFVAPGFVGAG